LIISGNPYHEWLKKWQPTINRNDFKVKLGIINDQKKILLYAPDPLSNVSGIEVYGFDELTITSILVDFFNKHSYELSNWIVLIKAHPNQNLNLLKKIISMNASFQLLPQVIDTNTIIFYSDIVMGFFSSFLIEADILNKRVLRFFEQEIVNDPIKELNIGVVVNIDSLFKELNSN